MIELVSQGPLVGRTLVFLPGFMTAPQSYRTMLQPLAHRGVRVVIASLYSRGLATLLGKVSVADEAAGAVDVIRSISTESPSERIFLAGHSRGGQAAFRAARLLSGDELAGLVLIDPVDGQGRNPSLRTSTMTPAGFTTPSLIVGAGVAGRCAPPAVNHVHFAEVTPHARHVVVSELGHADMLDDRPRASGRRLCGGSTRPDLGRQACSELVTWAVADECSSDLAGWLSPDAKPVAWIVR